MKETLCVLLIKFYHLKSINIGVHTSIHMSNDMSETNVPSEGSHLFHLSPYVGCRVIGESQCPVVGKSPAYLTLGIGGPAA